MKITDPLFAEIDPAAYARFDTIDNPYFPMSPEPAHLIKLHARRSATHDDEVTRDNQDDHGCSDPCRTDTSASKRRDARRHLMVRPRPPTAASEYFGEDTERFTDGP